MGIYICKQNGTFFFPFLGLPFTTVYTAKTKASLTAAGKERERERIMRTPMFLLLSLTFFIPLLLQSGAEASTTGKKKAIQLLPFTFSFLNASDTCYLLLLSGFLSFCDFLSGTLIKHLSTLLKWTMPSPKPPQTGQLNDIK